MWCCYHQPVVQQFLSYSTIDSSILSFYSSSLPNCCLPRVSLHLTLLPLGTTNNISDWLDIIRWATNQNVCLTHSVIHLSLYIKRIFYQLIDWQNVYDEDLFLTNQNIFAMMRGNSYLVVCPKDNFTSFWIGMMCCVCLR